MKDRPTTQHTPPGASVSRPTITEVEFTAASSSHAETGLLGWVSCNLNGTVRLDGLTLRRTKTGRLTISFPARRDGRGELHPLVRPLTDAARREIERQIFLALGLEISP